MKIRWDFVTNSSSTSFLIICKGKPKRIDFMAAMGVRKGSPLESFFEELYDSIIENSEPIGKFVGLGRWAESSNLYDLVKKEFSERTARRATSAEANGADIWFGRLDSDGSPAESFFCTESFEVEYSEFYLNALPCVW